LKKRRCGRRIKRYFKRKLKEKEKKREKHFIESFRLKIIKMKQQI
jgi:hypothetical protein